MSKPCGAQWNSPDFGMTLLHDPWYQAMVRLQDAFVKASMDFFTQRGFIYVPLPMTTSAISSPMGLGSDSLPVQVELGGKPVYLADSMQFLLEYVCRMAEKGCFYLMPSFRGEKTDERHLSQFFHCEAEIRGSLENILNLAEQYVIHLSRWLLETCREDIEQYAGTVSHLEKMAASSKIPRVTFREAMKLLKGHPEATKELSQNCCTISKYGEKLLMEWFGGCVWLTHFDAKVVPFYQAQDGGIARNADLLMGIGEILGAGERHFCAQQVTNALTLHQVAREDYTWYIQMKEQYPMQTAGFGLGMERFLLWVLRHDDIRDCQIVARMDGAAMTP